MVADCAAFTESCHAYLVAANEQGRDDKQLGHDFYLTRNGHGAGFWDRGLGKLGDELTAMADPFGSYELYIGDDGKLYGSD
jgi:hypothetical protein